MEGLHELHAKTDGRRDSWGHHLRRKMELSSAAGYSCSRKSEVEVEADRARANVGLCQEQGHLDLTQKDIE